MMFEPGTVAINLCRCGDLVGKHAADCPVSFGAKGVRDPAFPCTEYDPGPRSFTADCETDGHYMCDECRWQKAPAERGRDSG